MIIQPCDWQEHDFKYKYVVDVFGRTIDDIVVSVRLTGFSPYFYIKYDQTISNNDLKQMLSRESIKINSKYTNHTPVDFSTIQIAIELKLDVMNGFSGLTPIKVWKITCPSLKVFKAASRAAEKIPNMIVYETDLPPYIRLFHELDLSPASPFSFEGDEIEVDEDSVVDSAFTSHHKSVKPSTNTKIPLYLAAYDIEVFSESGNFPVASNPNDEVTQIGVSFRYTDDMLTSYKRIVFVNGTVDKSTDPTVEFIACRNEKHLLQRFEECIRTENPDAVCGYNTFGFDDGYITERAEKLKLKLKFGRVDMTPWKQDLVKTEKKTFELASGKFAVRYFDMPGRLPIDLLLSVRREQNLDSYKLDNVASTFLRDRVIKLERLGSNKVKIYTKGTRGLFVGNLVRFDIITNTINPYQEGRKFYVETVEQKFFIVKSDDEILKDVDISKLEWSFTKDDVTPQEMFESHHGTSAQRAEVAKYCIQDCDLVLTLMAKLDTLVNARGMADVCRVPIQYIFLRGQGIKIYSAVVYNASKRNQVIMAQEGIEGDTSYEGAIVLPPKIGMYLEQPIPVLDFNSLYPSNMIAYNLSPDTLVYVKTFDKNGRKIKQDGNFVNDGTYTVDEISYDTYDEEKNPSGRITCGFVQPNDDPRTIGILPLTLDILLKKRKETRKIMETTEDEAQVSVLNGLQLAYKVVANSVYGQCGSRTSPIRKFEVAACTTSAGRSRIYDAKRIVETEFGGDVIYGDTDSIFIKFPTTDLAESIKLGQAAADRITKSINRKPYKIEYEKTFYPFVLFCRKRYVGMMYEDDVTKCKRKSMGIAIKRRDNAPIVKDVFGGALDILMEHRSIRMAQTFVKEMLVDIIQNKTPLDKFIITKQLRDDYKNPGQIAHRVLADRMEERDPGNKPQVGDRLSFIHVAGREYAKKQGEKIEHIDYVKKHNLKPDVEFYITNQIQNPVAQMFALAIDDLEGYRSTRNYKKMYDEYFEKFKDEEEATLKVLAQKEKELDSILFLGAQYLKKHKVGPMDMFLKR
jgi:DNA polymerase elongation subunit (family B)